MFCVCRCYYTSNYYSTVLKRHVQFHDTASFLDKYKQTINKAGLSGEEVTRLTDELEREYQRRISLQDESTKRKSLISEQYSPLYPEVYTLQNDFLAPEFLAVVDSCKKASVTSDEVRKMVTCHTADRVYSMPVFTKLFCQKLLKELDHFRQSGLAAGRPNTMNRYGLLLNELGFDDGLLTPLRQHFLDRVSRLLFPDSLGSNLDSLGSNLDSHKTFTVQYDLSGDQDLAPHYDNSEVTLNVCLGREFEEGSLYFGGMRWESEKLAKKVIHQVSHGVLHRGQQLHGAMPVEVGERINLIMWMRSSERRNTLCPMCDQAPDLEPVVEGFGDGFTRKTVTVDVCTLH